MNANGYFNKYPSRKTIKYWQKKKWFKCLEEVENVLHVGTEKQNGAEWKILKRKEKKKKKKKQNGSWVLNGR